MAGAMVGLWIVFSFTNFWAGFLILMSMKLNGETKCNKNKFIRHAILMELVITALAFAIYFIGK